MLRFVDYLNLKFFSNLNVYFKKHFIECKDSLKTTYKQHSLKIISVNLSNSFEYEGKINYFCNNNWVQMEL